MIQALRVVIAAAALFAFSALGADAAPRFPTLTGRVVDQAQILSAAAEAELDGKLVSLENQTGRQVVVTTLASLQGLEIEEYGYQLGRAWGIGSKDDDDGALLIVAPNERKVRIEVGYGLEPVLTDTLSSVIIQSRILPKFRDGDLEAGVIAGTDAIIQQLRLPDGEARAKAAVAAPQKGPSGDDVPLPVIMIILFVIFVFLRIIAGGRRRRRSLGSALPWIILGGLNDVARSRGNWSSGGGWSGGGGFSGGGGSFGGGGASGNW